ncbi:ligase-associated DNA damage response exonuclease [Roseicella aquatilis]|uniref:Ligase-associated DNA damage response exonuclease n=1 Tax=Roseicella aquatilis TaxID=2527868 RepID=A0A4V2WJX9_9PROT|nr:ligase-associated DNA damage response exonuclease [Roseicella aquatilis]TCZ56277.1 ligase-associated DNA damage response exonuclease [Roseicella aquatilis]
MPPHPESWLRVTPQGLFCEPGGFFIDPVRPVERAVITHGHADHARPGHGAVLATAETLAIMRTRMGEAGAGAVQQPIRPGEVLHQGGVAIRLAPAGHVLGSAQVVLDWQGSRAVVSGDYKRQRDPTCAPFEPVPCPGGCDVFVTEATFALPVFRHPPPEGEVAKLLKSLALFPERTHVVGCYALGKAQRLIRLLREAGWEAPIHLHGALASLCRLYEELGVPLGPLAPATVANKAALRGAIVLAPPSAVQDRWARRLAEPVVAVASGWMQVRQRARLRQVELPMVISDHADWDDLNRSIDEVGAPEVWVTHGRDDALVHALGLRGIRGRALHLVGLGEEDEGAATEAAAPLADGEHAAGHGLDQGIDRAAVHGGEAG